MSEPIRLRDGADGQVRELMRYAQAEGAPSSARVEALTARVLAELNAPQSEPASRAFGAASVKWLIGIAIILGLGASAPRWLAPERTQMPSAHAAPIATRAAEPRAAPPTALGAQQSDRSPPEAPAQAAVPERPERPRVRTKPLAAKQAVRSAPLEATDPIAEVALLQRARRALASAPEAALVLAAQHGREHPAGMFSEEREAIAVEALWRTGDVARAVTRLRAMLLAYPRSTYRERLTTLLEGAVPEP